MSDRCMAHSCCYELQLLDILLANHRPDVCLSVSQHVDDPAISSMHVSTSPWRRIACHVLTTITSCTLSAAATTTTAGYSDVSGDKLMLNERWLTGRHHVCDCLSSRTATYCDAHIKHRPIELQAQHLVLSFVSMWQILLRSVHGFWFCSGSKFAVRYRCLWCCMQ